MNIAEIAGSGFSIDIETGIEKEKSKPRYHHIRTNTRTNTRTNARTVSKAYLISKRALDLTASALTILICFIPSLILCLAIRLESPGCPIYTQYRVKGIKPDGTIETFKMYKFRSMYKNADEMLESLADQNDADGPIFKMKNDPRVTGIGKFIRKHSIDEFPQFLNVFLGQLSLVGPRPPLPSEVAEYTPKQMKRLEVKQGLTGPWQTSSRSDSSFAEMVDFDLDYIETCSFQNDVKFILRTVNTMVSGDGAY